MACDDHDTVLHSVAFGKIFMGNMDKVISDSSCIVKLNEEEIIHSITNLTCTWNNRVIMISNCRKSTRNR